jgi:hypothetical protein
MMAGAAEGYPTVAKAVANTKKRGDLAGAEHNHCVAII